MVIMEQEKSLSEQELIILIFTIRYVVALTTFGARAL